MIVHKTANDFVLAEVSEWGWDYVEAKFAEGYEPTLTHGVWCWNKKVLTNVLRSGSATVSFSGGSCPVLPSAVNSLRPLIRQSS